MAVLKRCLQIATIFLLIETPLSTARAQLSPGKLSRAHQDLEGIRRCTECHEFGDNEIGPRCLACHVEIAARIRTGHGLHARPGHAKCDDCHFEHQGRDYDLVVWPKGRDAFDHRETGWPLAGAHARLKCRDCHRADHIKDVSLVRERHKNPGRTFLGLGAACRDCHRDEHGRQFERACDRCHVVDAWRPAKRFDHATARFRLDGRHVDTSCVKCHTGAPGSAAADTSGPWTRWKGLAFGNCDACHRDPHDASLGKDCAHCHATTGWRTVAAADFDHDRTRYPLRGRHAELRCERCHNPDAPARKVAYARCDDCHDDHHAAAPDGRRFADCGSCHSVRGFAPAAFAVARHDSTPFPLRGGHLAVACIACHAPPRAKAATPLFLRSDACTACHRDPHAGTTAKWQGDRGCAACHDVASWSRVAFDHGRTDFPLTGRHETTACRACHLGTAAKDAAPAWRFADTPSRCETCHRDPHHGQFAAAAPDNGTACERCHTPADWRALRFDHDQDTEFALTGGHKGVACNACHRTEGEGAAAFVRYRPVAKRCEACHAGAPAGDPRKGDRS